MEQHKTLRNYAIHLSFTSSPNLLTPKFNNDVSPTDVISYNKVHRLCEKTSRTISWIGNFVILCEREKWVVTFAHFQSFRDR